MQNTVEGYLTRLARWVVQMQQFYRILSRLNQLCHFLLITKQIQLEILHLNAITIGRSEV